MPLKIELKVAEDTFLLEGELGGPIDEQVVNLVHAWVMALKPTDPDAQVAEKITEVRDQIAAHRQSLAAGLAPDDTTAGTQTRSA